ncbi:EmrB/QacA subfamily drug resistance transporter [Actinomycetospora succinea]|uniref:EmrB/QacA subfamily drug resistance transporter n=1 Tax=Actinomycetospora succinea TaxID=663603 RepID=A0A4R6ULY9_9PSEU|nr:MFS transporter [Actinomycetospora succinea]TDQ46413.1 EmrB/QacA subfamily drug resistance transporter [Actinomycetospora succinea]
MSPRQRTGVLLLVSVTALMAALDTLVVSTALTTIRHDLGASVESLEWTVNAYNLTLAVLLVPAAALGDRFGRRRVFVAGLALFTVASAGCALAPDVGTLVVARAVQGVGAAAGTALGMTLVGAAYPPEQRGRALGVLEGVAGLAVLAGPGLGGVVTDLVGWEFVFWLNVPIGLVVVPLVLAVVPESRGGDVTMDAPGVVLLAGAALGVVWALTRGNVAGWASGEVLAAFGLAAVLTVAFVLRQRAAVLPLLPGRLVRAPGFVAGNLATAALFVSVFGGLFFFSQLLAVGLGFTPLQTGLGLMAWTSALFVLGPVGGVLADRFGNRIPLTVGLALTALGMAWVAAAASGLSYGDLVPGFVVASIGGSLAMPAAANAVLGGLGPDDVGKAAGVNSTLRELGGVLGLAVLVAVFAPFGSYDSPAGFLAGFVPAIWVCVAIVAAGAVAGACVPGPVREAAQAQGCRA